jgi:Fe-S-cluster containining protein
LNATGETIACARGCGFCCSFRVAVRADEVFLLVDHLRATREAEAVDRIRQRVVDVAARFSRMTAERRMRTNAACALLEDGACSVYDVRPHTCRAHHAVDVEGCRLSVEDPERSDILSGSIPAVEVVCSGHGDGLVDALEELGLDVEVYEMNAALAAALTDEAPRRRYVAGEAAFPGARFDD